MAGCPGVDTDLDIFLALVDGDFNSMFVALSGIDGNIDGDALEILGVSSNGAVTGDLTIGKWTGKIGEDQFDLGPNPDSGFIKYVNFWSVSITDYATHSGASYSIILYEFFLG